MNYDMIPVVLKWSFTSLTGLFFAGMAICVRIYFVHQDLEEVLSSLVFPAMGLLTTLVIGYIAVDVGHLEKPTNDLGTLAVLVCPPLVAIISMACGARN